MPDLATPHPTASRFARPFAKEFLYYVTGGKPATSRRLWQLRPQTGVAPRVKMTWYQRSSKPNARGEREMMGPVGDQA